MKLITYYIVISLIANVAVVALCLAIEQVVPWASLPIFLTLFFLILWAAWVLAVRMTEPKTKSAPVRCNGRPAGLIRRPSRARWNDGEAGASRLPLRLSGMIDLSLFVALFWDRLAPKEQTNRRTHVGARLEAVSHRTRQGGVRRVRLRHARRLRQAPALVIIDVNWAFCGDRPEPILESIKRWRNSCGEDAWTALPYIRSLIDKCHEKGVPVIYTTGVRREDNWDSGSWSWKNNRNNEDVHALVPNIDGNEIVTPIAPAPQDIVIYKQKPSGFFGSNMASYLTLLGCDSVIVTGTTTSGCVRATVLDAFSLNYRVAIAEEGCFDRSQASHAINLCDMNAKYADVVKTSEALAFLDGLKPGHVRAPERLGNAGARRT